MEVAVWTASAAEFECAAKAGNTAKPIQVACSETSRNQQTTCVEFMMYMYIIFIKHTGRLFVKCIKSNAWALNPYDIGISNCRHQNGLKNKCCTYPSTLACQQ